MDFGEAIKNLKMGRAIGRTGWKMCDFESFVKGLEMEHIRKCFFTQKFKIVRGCGIDGAWVRLIVSNSNNPMEQIAFDLNEGNYLVKTPKNFYSHMIAEWKRIFKDKGRDFFQAEWERVNVGIKGGENA